MDLLRLYRDEIASLGYSEDEAQVRCIARLQRVADDLRLHAERRDSVRGKLARFFRKEPETVVRGVYLWGGVGRGKTFLMDLFFRNLPIERKERVHFHRFMLSIHKSLRERKSEDDPLSKIAAEIASRVSVLCFDELFVADITDAMVLARLFTVLLESGVVLVFTSNTEPRNLYRDGLQKERFPKAFAVANDK